MKFLTVTFGLVIFFSANLTFGQQQSQYSMYMMNNYTLNPAVGGTEDYTDIKASFRKQWAGFGGAPTNFYVSAHTSINKVTYEDADIASLPHHGVGGYAYRDTEGASSKIGIYGSYSYHLPLTKKLTASIGAFVGIQNLSLDANQLEFHDDALGIADPSVDGKLSKLLPDANIGTWLYHENYYVGASFYQVFGNSLNLNSITNGTEKGKLNNHFFVTAGYRVPLNQNLIWVPSVLVKAVAPAPIQVDLNSKFKYKEMYWGGISYRNLDAVVLLAGITLADHWDIGYSYDITFSNINKYSNGSHEVLIGYRFGKSSTVKPTSQFW